MPHASPAMSARRASAPICLRSGRRDPPGWARSSSGWPRPAIAVTAARRELVADLDGELAQAPALFPPPAPRAGRRARGLARRRCRRSSAEQRLAESLAASPRAGRPEPAAPRSGRTAATSRPPTRGAARPPPRCSTGRQKAYLISILLAQAQLRLRRLGDLPILLLDEVTAHLDPRRRSSCWPPWSTSARSAGSPAPRPGCSTRILRSGHFFHVVNGALTPHE